MERDKLERIVRSEFEARLAPFVSEIEVRAAADAAWMPPVSHTMRRLVEIDREVYLALRERFGDRVDRNELAALTGEVAGLMEGQFHAAAVRVASSHREG